MRFAWASLSLLLACGVRFEGGPSTDATAGSGGAAQGVGGSAAGGDAGGDGGQSEDCHNGVDDDGNGAIDCDDAACVEACSADAFVDDDAPPGGDGSLDDPFDDIAAATSVCDGTPKTIFVFAGAYGPFVLPPSCRVVGESRTGVIVDGAVTQTVAVPDGGSPAAELARLTLTGGDAQTGGCLMVVSGSVVLSELAITSCRALRGGGVAIDGGSVSATDVVVTSSSADEGGGWSVSGGTLTASNCTAANNAATQDGGALHVAGVGSVTFELSTFGNGNAAEQGGAIFQAGTGSELGVSRSRIVGNAAAAYGGGIHHAEGQLGLINVFVTDNVASNQSGGIHQAGGPALFTHVTIANNTAPNYPGGICCAGGSGAHRNMLIWGNTGGGSHGCPLSTSSIQEGPCCGNTSVDPLFVDPAGGDYHLMPGSPVIDYGDSATSSAIDFDGDPRDANPDPGADEAP